MDLSRLNRSRKDTEPVHNDAAVEEYVPHDEPNAEGAYEVDGQPGIFYRDVEDRTEILDDDGSWVPVNEYANRLPPGHSQLSVRIRRGDVIEVHHSGAGGAAVAAALPHMLAHPGTEPTSFQLPAYAPIQYTTPSYLQPTYTPPEYQQPNYAPTPSPAVPPAQAPYQDSRTQQPTDRRSNGRPRQSETDEYDPQQSYTNPVVPRTRQERVAHRKHLRGNAVALAIIAASPFVYHVVGGVAMIGGKDSIVDIQDPVHMFHKPMHDAVWIQSKIPIVNKVHL